MKRHIILYKILTVSLLFLIIVWARRGWIYYVDEKPAVKQEYEEFWHGEEYAILDKHKKIDYEELRYKKAYKQGGMIPILSWVGDVVGIGRVTKMHVATAYKEWDGSFVDLTVDTFWRGDPGTNRFRLQIQNKMSLPEKHTPIVFFLTKHGRVRGLCEMKDDNSCGTHSMEEDCVRSFDPPGSYWFYHDGYSWFYADECNVNLMDFTSNIVFAANFNNTNSLFRVLCDGYANNPEESRIRNESYVMLMNLNNILERDFVTNAVLNEPLLPEFIKDHLLSNPFR